MYCSSFDEKAQLIFEIYDFDSDGFITKHDISTIMASLPVINFSSAEGPNAVEGKFTREGGGLDNFDQRVESMEEMSRILELCFGGQTNIDQTQFKKINEDISSDTVLAVLGLFRERLPCSENFWRYKRNYDLHMKSMNTNNAGASNDSSKPTDGTSQGN